MDVLGERGLRKLLGLADLPQPDHETAYSATMLGDVLSNGLYYSLVGSGRHSLRRGAAAGRRRPAWAACCCPDRWAWAKPPATAPPKRKP